MSKRVSLILGDVDAQVVDPFLTGGSVEHEVLKRWADQRGDRVTATEASALRALLHVAAEALRDEVLDAGYAQMATWYHDEESDAERDAALEHYADDVDAATA